MGSVISDRTTYWWDSVKRNFVVFDFSWEGEGCDCLINKEIDHMINQLISMAAWKGMGQKNFPLWPLINAYNQQPERLLEMTRAGFFPTEQGPMPLGQKQLPDPNQQIEIVDDKGKVHYGTLHQSKPDDTHLSELRSEIKELKDVVKAQSSDISNLIRLSDKYHSRIENVEKRLTG